MSDPVTEITWKDFDKTFDREAGRRHRFKVRRYRGQVLDVEDVHFRLDSAVLMPDSEPPAPTGAPSGAPPSPPPGPAPPADANRVTGLAALRSAYRHAEAEKAQKLLITGHTDRSGPDEYNEGLSRLRADNVLHLLLGNRAEWVKVSDKKHKLADVQQILKWTAANTGWDCDPGAVDGVAGPKTSGATKKFQVAYNAAVAKTPAEWPEGGKIAEDGVVGPQTWGAFYDVYSHELAELCETDAAGLSAKRKGLAGRFVDGGKKAVGCGENHPLTANTVANRRSQVDRRVEILFFDPGEEPPLACHPSAGSCDAKSCRLYDPKRYSLRPLGTEPVSAKTLVEPRVDVEYSVVLLDPDLAKHQDANRSDNTPEEKIVADRVTYIEVSAKKSGGDAAYAKGGKLEVVEGADKVKIYTDMRCTQLLDRPLTNAELFREKPFILYVAAEKEGAFKLKLVMEPADDKRAVVKEMEPVEMSVVKLDLKLHQLDEAVLQNVRFDAAKDTLDQYYAALEAKTLPKQKEMTEVEQVKPGRVLHAQKDGNHGRAKLLLKKLAGAWPAGTDDYLIVVNAEGDSGGLKLFDQEFDGTEKPIPHKLKVSELKADDVELWVEGATATKRLRDVVLDVGIDREEGGLEKLPKRCGDWARFNVLQIAELKLDYTAPVGGANAWDSAKKRFYINLEADPGGRKIKLVAKLSEKVKDVPVHFALSPHKDNGKSAHWGVDLPNTWKWKSIAASVRTDDRTAPNILVHKSVKTDADGKAEIELHLSRFGGDVFEPSAYLSQDAHLSKYVCEHATLKKRKPFVMGHKITVWRRFWYEEVKVTGLNVAGFFDAPDTYDDVRVEMLAAPVKQMARATANGINPRVIYPKNMISYYLNPARTAYINNYPGDAGDGLVVGDANESRFFALTSASAERPVKIPMINVHGLWIADGNSGAVNPNQWFDSTAFPLSVRMDKQSLDPPLQGGTLLASGNWQSQDWDPAANGGTGAWGNPRNGAIAAANVTLDPSRSDPFTVQVALPTGVVVAPGGTMVWITNLTIRGGTNFLGTSYPDGIVNCYTPNDENDFVNTINHEIGHSFHQVADPARTAAGGIPNHPLRYLKDGAHCNYAGKACVMYESGPQPGSLNRYCPTCHPYLLIEDMRTR